MAKIRPVILTILDGWGLSPSWGGNVISMSNPSTINWLWKFFPHKILQAFSKIVGPVGKVGNSEFGHACIGGGRIVKEDSTDISESISDGSFFTNPVLLSAFQIARKKNSNLHLLGLLSDGAVHAHIDHLIALISLAKKQNHKNLYLHLITDGMDTPLTAGIYLLKKVLSEIKKQGVGEIGTLVGRYYGMDRDKVFSRTRQVFLALVKGKGVKETDPQKALITAYKKGFSDFNLPSLIMVDQNGKILPRIKSGDSVIFFNYRSDRARQITEILVKSVKDLFFVTMTDYGVKVPVHPAYLHQKLSNTLPEIISKQNFSQLHIGESEKYAHVTYFFNGGREEPFPGEERIIIPSLKVKFYNQRPEMRAKEITQAILDALAIKKYDFILANYPNVDMVGHSGDIVATNQAVMVVDQMIKEIAEAILKINAVLIITADHGNAEQMIRIHLGPSEATHTLSPVPFILVSSHLKKDLVRSAIVPPYNLLSKIITSKNSLADIAPTILELFGLDKPKEMTGSSLLKELE